MPEAITMEVWDLRHEQPSPLPVLPCDPSIGDDDPAGQAEDVICASLLGSKDLAPFEGWVRSSTGAVWWYTDLGLGGIHVEPANPEEWDNRPTFESTEGWTSQRSYQPVGPFRVLTEPGLPRDQIATVDDLDEARRLRDGNGGTYIIDTHDRIAQ